MDPSEPVSLAGAESADRPAVLPALAGVLPAAAPAPPAPAPPVGEALLAPPDGAGIRRRRLGWWLGGAALIGAASVGAVVLALRGSGQGGPIAADGAPSTTRSTAKAVAPPVPSASMAASATAASTATAPVVAPSTGPSHAPTAPAALPSPTSPTAPGDLVTCMAPLFPADTFSATRPNFDFLCQETHARKGGTALKVEVVRASARPGALPLALQEWARLGWYEMAVFALARARCCPSPPPLATPLGIEACPLDAALQSLGVAAAGADDAAVEQAIAAYTEVAVCLVQAGAAKAFGQTIKPTKDATDTFRTIVARLRSQR